MDTKAKRELASAIVAANAWAMRSGKETSPGHAAKEALDATYKGDKDLRRLLELVMWWPADAEEWAQQMLR